MYVKCVQKLIILNFSILHNQVAFDYSERTGQCWMYSETYSMTFVFSSAWESEKCLSASSFERNSFAQTVHLNVPPSYSDISQGKGQGVFIGKVWEGS